jgi:mono/diheme cytochrome c family protein
MPKSARRIPSHSSVASRFLTLAATLFLCFTTAASDTADYNSKIKPILTKYCYDCHGDGMKKGQVTLDHFKDDSEMLADHDLWFRVLKNVRAQTMPPAKKDQPTPAEIAALETWIKSAAFGIDPANPDPGRVTVRRLNRVEYQNTIRDLMGVNFNTTEEFPPDDTGYGFDNIGDVLTISPLLLEKYFEAAQKIVVDAVPTVARTMEVKTVEGRRFKGEGNPDNLDLYKPASLSYSTKLSKDGDYRITLDLNVRGAFNFDPARANLVFKINGEEKLRQEFGWENNKKHRFDYAEKLSAGDHKFELSLEPLVKEEEKKTFVNIKVNSIVIAGPTDPENWAKTPNYSRFFTQDEPPADAAERKKYAREVIARFTKKAFRRPVDDKTVERLLSIAEESFSTGKNFEDGVRQAFLAVLASPRFLYRIEESTAPNEKIAPLDEYALASRLSYFLWSTMPDEELFRLAEQGKLRSNLKAQVDRMLADGRSQEFVENFTGQWLQVRDVEGIAINERAVAFRDSDLPRPEPGQRRRGNRVEPKFELDGELRRAMQEETQEYFKYIMREDRSIREMLDSDYTFVNEKLAKVYEIPGVEGRQTRKVTLPEGSPRGGMLTHGSVLVVTSNPTRTSPVKRGVFILDNFLGTPPPPAPPDVPDLEDAEKEFKDREPTLREALELHASSPLCSSCHTRMDPLGLALENFNALGAWREKERGQPIDSSSQLITGEQFDDIRGLRKILAEKRYMDFYRCLTEKVLTYALGRGLEFYDVATVDTIVAELDKTDGKFSSLLMGIIESAPFQKRRNVSAETASARSAAQNENVALNN